MASRKGMRLQHAPARDRMELLDRFDAGAKIFVSVIVSLVVTFIVMFSATFVCKQTYDANKRRSLDPVVSVRFVLLLVW